MVGEYFAELETLLDSKNTLQYAWNIVFNRFPIEKEALEYDNYMNPNSPYFYISRLIALSIRI